MIRLNADGDGRGVGSAAVEAGAEALLCARLPHGETAAVCRLLFANHGLMAVYVHGARSRRLAPLLQPGNRLAVTLAGGRQGGMPRATIEPVAQRAALIDNATALIGIAWLCTLTAAVLPEGAAHPALFTALDAITAGAAAGIDDVALGVAAVRYEALLLAELGFGLDLSCCVATGARYDLAYVSPKSAQAVSRSAGAPYAARLLPLPDFLRPSGAHPIPDAGDIAAGFALTGHFLARTLLRAGPLTEARDRLLARFLPIGR